VVPKPKHPEIPDIRVEDPKSAYQKFEDFTRRIMNVPRKEIEAKLATEKSAKRPRKR
jgi:hypothetical protein